MIVQEKKKNDEEDVSISTIKLFRYADRVDVALLVISTIAALLASAIYTIVFIMYGHFSGIFVEFVVHKKIDIVSNWSNNSYVKIDGSRSFDKRIGDGIVFYIILGCASIVANFISNVCWCVATDRQIRKIRNCFFEKISSQEIGFFDKNTPAYLNSVMTNHIDKLKEGIGLKFSKFIFMTGLGISCFIIGIVSAWKLALIGIALISLIFVSNAIMVVLMKKHTIREIEACDHSNDIAQDILTSVRTAYSLGLQYKKVKIYEDSLEEEVSLKVKKSIISGIFSGISWLFYYSIFTLGVSYGVYLVKNESNQFTLSGLVQTFLALATLVHSVEQSIPFLKYLAEAKIAAKMIFKFLDKKSEIDVKQHKGRILETDKFEGNIEFKNVSFNYPQRLEVKILQDLNLFVPAGKSIGLCGASGGGKSTVVQLLQRFYDPLFGTIEIDGHDIKQLDLEWLRKQISVVSQEPVLFTLSIKENIRLGRLSAIDDEIIEAAKEANAHDFIKILDCGYDTIVGERGTSLSGGQKQRIAIARALIRNSKILLLDESTSSLDLENERLVQDALDKAKRGRTTIVIAHRLSTIQNADLIVAMSEGKVVEMGTHDELMASRGTYFELVNRQIAETTATIDSKSPKQLVDARLSSSLDSLKKQEKNDDSLSFETPFKLECKLLKNSKPEAGHIVIGVLSQLISGSAYPLILLAFCEVYEIFALDDSSEVKRKSAKATGIIIAISFTTVFTTIIHTYMFGVAGARLTKRLRSKMFCSIFRQEIAWHDREENSSSILATRLSVTVPLCQALTIDTTNLLSYALSSVGVALIMSLVFEWRLALVAFAFVPLNLLCGIVTSGLHLNTNEKGVSPIERGAKVFTECVENIKTLVSLGREEYFHGKFREIFRKKAKRSFAFIMFRAVFYAFNYSQLFFIQAATLGYGYYLVKTDGLSSKYVFTIYTTITFSSLVLGRILIELPDRNKTKEAVRSTLKVIERKSRIDSMSEEGLRPNKLEGRIQFHNVYFKYPTRDNSILSDLSFDVSPNETTALCGHSGCGKSTIIQLLLRFYDVDKGKITLDGVDIRELNIKWLRAQIGLVSQHPHLFNCSIFENISYGDLDRPVSMEEVAEAAKQANIHQRVENLPEKYSTIVGTKGGQLSGGEKQRIAIARAILKKPIVLLLDEATSDLDSHSERLVQDALDRAQQGRTCISIAHRQSTIQNAAKFILFKSDGCIERRKSDNAVQQDD